MLEEQRERLGHRDQKALLEQPDHKDRPVRRATEAPPEQPDRRVLMEQRYMFRVVPQPELLQEQYG